MVLLLKELENSGKENRMLNLSRIWIGDQCDRWNELRSVLRVKTNAEVAKIRMTGLNSRYLFPPLLYSNAS
jgi:hypothetical protein